MIHIGAALLERSGEHPERTLIIDEGGCGHSYQEIAVRACGVAESLIRDGLEVGGRILLLCRGRVDYVGAYYGAVLAGGAAVGLNPATTPKELTRIANDCEPTHCLIAGDVPESVIAALPKKPLRMETVGAPHNWESRHPPLGGGESLAQIIYTSGTTGEPKGVMLSHRALVANTESIVEYLDLRSSDRAGVVLDFSYSYGNSVLQTHVRTGGSLVLLGSLTFPGRVLSRLDERSCTGFYGVPSTYALLLAHAGGTDHPDCKDLRYMCCAGGPLPPANLERLRQLFPGVTVFLMYGQTEASARLSYLPPKELDRRPESIGKGIPGVTLEVLREDGSPVDPGEEGEIVASGDNLMSGYWGDPEATAEKLRGGRLWTGDLATVDDEGFITITGRRSDLVKSGAYRIHPKEVEEALVELDGVHDCVVVGIPDPLWGEALVACFPEGGGRSLAEIRRHLRGRLPEYKWPRRVVELPEIYRTRSGKAKRRAIAQRITAGETPPATA